MSQPSPEEPFSQAHLDSPEYRERLMRKLNCLIAVLEVATAKVHKSLEGPEADVERLSRIRGNLQSTLDVCLRARAALERRDALPLPLPENLDDVMRATAAASDALVARPRRQPMREFKNEAERRKFQRLAPIAANDIRACDLEDLMRKLQG